MINTALKNVSPKRQTKSKPWITPALSNSIKIKNRVYKQFCKASDPIKKRKLHEWFKNYRNLTTILTRVCKEDYYKSFFQDNKKDFKKIWEGIRSIVSVTNKKSIQNINLNIDNKTITDDEVISDHFNKFFDYIAGNLVRKIPNTTKTFDSHLNNLKTPFSFHLYHQMMLKH